MAKQFGKLPIQMRQFVRHVVTIPPHGGSAYETGGSIVFSHPVKNMTSVIVHEIAHSFDLNGAYGLQLSSSDEWWGNYSKDTHVPDSYSQLNAMENVAQNTVLAIYNENADGDYAGIEPRWDKVFHQFATIITMARRHGDGNSILHRGQRQHCSHRIPPSDLILLPGQTDRSRDSFYPAPDVRLKLAQAANISLRVRESVAVDAKSRGDELYARCLLIIFRTGLFFE